MDFAWLLALEIGLTKEDYLQIFECVFFWIHSFCG